MCVETLVRGHVISIEERANKESLLVNGKPRSLDRRTKRRGSLDKRYKVPVTLCELAERARRGVFKVSQKIIFIDSHKGISRD